MTAAFEHAEVADLCIVVGSSCRVTPAADVPARVAARGKTLVIVNLQATPLDDAATLVVHAKIDAVFAGLEARLTPAPAASAAASPVPAPCEEQGLRGSQQAAPHSSAPTLHIGNTAVPVAGQAGSFDWTVAVTAADAADIASVTFHLHPTFTPSSVTVSAPPFQVCRRGWGTFTVVADVALAAGGAARLEHALCFDALLSGSGTGAD